MQLFSNSSNMVSNSRSIIVICCSKQNHIRFFCRCHNRIQLFITAINFGIADSKCWGKSCSSSVLLHALERAEVLVHEHVIAPHGVEEPLAPVDGREHRPRFAIEFHRQLRGKGMTASILDEVEGLGPVRKKALLKHFKSFKRLKAASLQDILDAKVVPVQVANELYTVLQQYNEQTRNEMVVGGEGDS